MEQTVEYDYIGVSMDVNGCDRAKDDQPFGRRRLRSGARMRARRGECHLSPA